MNTKRSTPRHVVIKMVKGKENSTGCKKEFPGDSVVGSPPLHAGGVDSTPGTGSGP